MKSTMDWTLAINNIEDGKTEIQDTEGILVTPRFSLYLHFLMYNNVESKVIAISEDSNIREIKREKKKKNREQC